MVLIAAVLCRAVESLPALFLSENTSALHPGFISLALAAETNPAEQASHITPTAAPVTTGGTATITSPQQEQGSPAGLPPREEQQQQPAPPTSEAKPLGFVDTLHGSLSRRLQESAAWLDSFFSNESYLKEENHSYLRVRYDAFKEEGAPATMKPAFDLRLALPKLEKKTHLIFSAEPAEPPVGAAAPVQTAGEHFGRTEQQNVTTAVHYIFRSSAKESFLVRSGLQFSKFKPVVFAAPRYRALFPLDSWNMRFTQEVLYRTDTTWQTDTRFEFERLLRPDFFFRTSVDGVWAARVKGYLCSLGFSLSQTINPTHVLDYDLINFYQVSPGELTEVDFRIRYRHSFWRNWLFFEVSPQVRFPRNRNFEDTPGILFRLEMFIGEMN